VIEEMGSGEGEENEAGSEPQPLQHIAARENVHGGSISLSLEPAS
jgi:hypothetical protein